MDRPYDAIAKRVSADGDVETRMRLVADAIWDACHERGVSWVGFYLPSGGELVLGPSRDKPACSPIGLHGACGQAFRSRKPLVVRDVNDLGIGYIACDPRDRSEIVVPLLDAGGMSIGVLDLDSYDVAAFSHRDASGLIRILTAAGLTHSPHPQ